MTETRPQSLKLVLDGEMRKVTDVPKTLAAFRKLLLGLFGSDQFSLKYTDEEGDLVTIASDEELTFAYAQAQSVMKVQLFPATTAPSEVPKTESVGFFASFTKSVKEAFLKGKDGLKKGNLRRQFEQQFVRAEVSRILGVPLPPQHEGISCHSCKENPILGVRYKCTVCSNINFCEICEATKSHEHTLLKLRTPESPAKKPSFLDLLRGETGPKAEVITRQWDENALLLPGQQFLLTWLVRNSGKGEWPEGTKIQHVRGKLFAPAAEVLLIPPDAEGEVGIFVSVPKAEGRVQGVFSLADKKGNRFGSELEAELMVHSEPDPTWNEKVELLLSMGFGDRDAVVAALEAFEWDVSRAAEQLAS